MGELEPAVGVPLEQSGDRDVDLAEHLARFENVGIIAGHEIHCVNDAFRAVGAHSVYVASSATVMVIIGPAGSDMQMLPPTVADSTP